MNMKSIDDVTNYRARIYENYSEIFMDSTQEFDELGAQKWGKGYRFYLRDWLPQNKEASIVDLACGSGRLLYFFKQSGFTNFSGVDISPAQIRLASQVVTNVFGANILDWLRNNSASFDLITGLDIIEHLRKSEIIEFLDLCYYALKPGGRIIFSTPNCESIWGNMHRYHDFTHEVGFTHNSLSRLLLITGFKEVESREIGPVPKNYSLISSCRYILWQLFRIGIKLWNLVETGSPGSGIFTRVFIISAIKK